MNDSQINLHPLEYQDNQFRPARAGEILTGLCAGIFSVTCAVTGLAILAWALLTLFQPLISKHYTVEGFDAVIVMPLAMAFSVPTYIFFGIANRCLSKKRRWN